MLAYFSFLASLSFFSFLIFLDFSLFLLASTCPSSTSSWLTLSTCWPICDIVWPRADSYSITLFHFNFFLGRSMPSWLLDGVPIISRIMLLLILFNIAAIHLRFSALWFSILFSILFALLFMFFFTRFVIDSLSFAVVFLLFLLFSTIPLGIFFSKVVLLLLLLFMSRTASTFRMRFGLSFLLVSRTRSGIAFVFVALLLFLFLLLG